MAARNSSTKKAQEQKAAEAAAKEQEAAKAAAEAQSQQAAGAADDAPTQQDAEATVGEQDQQAAEAFEPEYVVAEVVEKFRDKDTGSILHAGIFVVVAPERFAELEAAGVAKEAEI